MTSRDGRPPPAGQDLPAGRRLADLPEDSAEELYEHAPCGYLTTLMDGTIVKINTTLLGWLGRTRGEVLDRLRFADLLTVGGKLYHETHYAPLLGMKGQVNGIALELAAADGSRLPILVTSVVKRGEDGEPLLIRTTVFDARERRAYERELLRGRRAAEEAGRIAEEALHTAEEVGRVAEQARRAAETDRVRLREALAVLQRSLLPDALPTIEGLKSAAYYHTAAPDRLGGDFYDLFALDARRWAFFLGDVCGKGPEAAAVTSLARYTLRTTVLHDPDPAAALATLNGALFERYTGAEPQYCSAVFAVLERAGPAFTVHLASGGHPPPLLLRGDGTADYLPAIGGLLVGILPEPHFASLRIVLNPGDTLLLYTDGLTEARIGPDRRLYGEDALLDFGRAMPPGAGPHTLIAALRDLVTGFGTGLADDTALLAVGVPPARGVRRAAGGRGAVPR
ncbi:SpoIIE family protein phosphatase [Streptomyces sp. NBC_01476]|uniref:PP2C family protein-serine/threonine phosphatase n=1 Tax=Streptomyces sp. NBC_01476 TaxID=2903881 RepID=UPI002E333A8A|nr:SpoIIE family protein phosphatase [Streptomyces sp. NBC_01476]